MLIFILFATIAALLLFALGVLLPHKVFLGKAATRERVMQIYGIPGLIGFFALMVIAPDGKDAAPVPTAETKSIAESQDGRLKQIQFAEIVLPGRLSDAKSSGFTECTADYYGYTCQRARSPKLLGLDAKSASLTLDGRDYFSEVYLTPQGHSGDVRKIAAEELSYGEVTLTFIKSEYDLSCQESYQQKTNTYSYSPSCITNENSIGQLHQALLDAGWVLTRTKGGYLQYVHPAEPVEITIKDETASIRRISGAIVKELVARDTKRRASLEAAEANSETILHQLK